MLKKEFNEILRQSLFFVCIVVGASVLLSILSLVFGWSVTFGEFLAGVYSVGTGIFAMVTGVTLFAMERKQGGIEYLLTLPLSRTRLLWAKVLPRFATLAVFSLLYLPLLYVVTGGKGADAVPVLPPLYVFYAVFVLFFLSVSLSASHDNVVLLLIGVAFIFIVHISLIVEGFQSMLWKGFTRMLFLKAPHIAVLGIVGLVLPFIVPFVLSFKRFDIHPVKRFNGKFLKLFIPLIIVGGLFSVIYTYGISETGHKTYYLTKEHKLIESDWFSARLHHKDGGDTTELDSPFRAYYSELIELDGYIYTRDYSRQKIRMLRLNPDTGEVENVYDFMGRTSFYARGYWFFGKTLAFFEGDRYRDKTNLVLLNVDTKAFKTIELTGKIPVKKQRLWLFGTDEIDGKRFWLLASERSRKYPVFRVWEDGTIEKLGMTVKKPEYAKGMLITLDDEGMIFSKLTAEGMEEIKRAASGKNVFFHRFWSGRPDLSNTPRKEIYGVRFGKERHTLMRVDLETLDVTKVTEAAGRFRWFSPDECYLFSDYGKPGKLYRVQRDGQLKMLRDFTGFDGSKWGHRFNLSKYGVIVREGDNVSVYAFPELKELTFKDLN